jgi:hypothetical protein
VSDRTQPASYHQVNASLRTCPVRSDHQLLHRCGDTNPDTNRFAKRLANWLVNWLANQLRRRVPYCLVNCRPGCLANKANRSGTS